MSLYSEGYPSEMIFRRFGFLNLLNKDAVLASIQYKENTKKLKDGMKDKNRKKTFSCLYSAHQ